MAKPPFVDAPAGNHGCCILYFGLNICLNKYSYHDSCLTQGNGLVLFHKVLTKSPLDSLTISIYFSYFFALYKMSRFAKSTLNEFT